MKDIKNMYLKIQKKIARKKNNIERIDNDIDMLRSIITNNKYVYYKSMSDSGIISVDSDVLYKKLFLSKLINKRNNNLRDINYLRDKLSIYGGVNPDLKTIKKRTIERKIEDISTKNINIFNKTEALLKKNSELYDAVSSKLDLIEENLKKNARNEISKKDRGSKNTVEKKTKDKTGSFINRISNAIKNKGSK